MAKVLLLSTANGASGVSQNSALTRYLGIHSGCFFESGTENTARTTFYTAGTLSRIYMRVTANTINGDTTVTSRKNNAAGNQTFTVPNSTSGHFSDTTNSDSIASTDTIDMRIVTGGSSGTLTYWSTGAQFAATTNTVIRYHSIGGTSMARNATHYRNLSANGSINSTEANVQHEFGTGGTLKNLRFNCNSYGYTGAGDSDFFVRKNGADTAIGASFGGTGVFTDLTNTASIAENDLVNYRITTETGSGSQVAQIDSVGIDFETTNAKYDLIAHNAGGITNSITVYYSVVGIGQNNSTESNVLAELGHAGNVTRLWCYATSGGSTSKVTLRKNGASETGIEIAPTASGYFEDTGSVSFTATDHINYTRTGLGTTIRTIGLTIENTETAAARRVFVVS